MKQLTFKLIKESTRPILQISNIKALFDTGAEIPVWVASKRAFDAMFPDAVLRTEEVPLTGFGETVICSAYNCSFCLGELTFPNIPILLHEISDSPFQMILSASMFSGLMFEFDMINFKLNISVPSVDTVRNLKVFDSKGHLHVLFNESNKNIWNDYCKKYHVQNENQELLRLQSIYNTTDLDTLLEVIEHDYLQ